MCSEYPTRWNINLRLFLASKIHVLIHRVCLIIASSLHHKEIRLEWLTRLIISSIITRGIRVVLFRSSKVYLSRGFISLLRLVLVLWLT
jgi:hypothetical protein